jgi:hypothetical protein
MLKRVIYETLPYCYLAVGFLAMTQFPLGLGQLSAIILFVSGTAIWIMRSNYRRKDKMKLQRLLKSKQLPFWFYESLPFMLACISAIVFSIAAGAGWQWLLLLPVTYAFWRIAQRVKFRQHGWIQSSEAKLI